MSKTQVCKLCLPAVCLLGLALLVFLPYVSSAQSTSRTFPETGKTVSSIFLQYWDAHGSLAQQGYPISEEMQEKSDTDGKTYTVQYFERAVFEKHPENQPPNDVLLSLLGVFRYKDKYPNSAPSQQANNTPGSVLFPQTGKRLGGTFLKYWQAHGGLAQDGYPISDEFQEVSALDNKSYTVQYFQRAVFELHPENAGTQYEVLLSQLGTFRYQALYTSTPTPSPTMSAAAAAYLQEALDYIQQASVAGDKVDWQTLRRETVDYANSLNAQTTADTYPAIKSALSRINDEHARLTIPQDLAQMNGLPSIGLILSLDGWVVRQVLPNSLAEKAGMLPGDTIVQINGKPVQGMNTSDFFTELYGQQNTNLSVLRAGVSQPVTVSLQHPPMSGGLIPHGRRLPGDIGYISLPPNALSGTGTTLNPAEEYGSITQQVIKAVDEAGAAPTCGWIVDLQLNIGGNSWVMILGAGPILGDGQAGTYIYPDGRHVPWSYVNGSYLSDQPSAISVPEPYHLKQPMPPVAILTGRSTASAGEQTLISFRGREGVRSFGEPTYGVPNAAVGKTLSDGALINLAGALLADRTGHVYAYNERIAPDQEVASEQNFAKVGTDDDRVLQSATGWLQSQGYSAPVCQGQYWAKLR